VHREKEKRNRRTKQGKKRLTIRWARVTAKAMTKPEASEIREGDLTKRRLEGRRIGENIRTWIIAQRAP